MTFLTDYFLLDVGVLLAGLLTATYFHFKSVFKYWEKRNVPCVEPEFPYGNTGRCIFLNKPIGKIYKEHYEKLEGKKYGGTYYFTRRGFIILDPDLIKNVLVKDFSSFHDHGFYVNTKVDPLNENLFMMSGSQWDSMRAKLTPLFTSKKMKMMFNTMHKFAQELQIMLKESADKEEVIEIKDVTARYTTDIISSCALGIQCNCLKDPDAEFRKWGIKFVTPTLTRALSGLICGLSPTLQDILRIPSIDPEVSRDFERMIKETVECREKNNIKRDDIMQQLIEIKNGAKTETENEGETSNDVHTNAETNYNSSKCEEIGLSMTTLAAQAFVFFVGGFETSSSTMAFALYELSIHPEIQERAREEIDTVLENHGGELTYKAIEEMEYLDKIFSETLRKYTAVPLINRVCTKEYRIPDTDVVLEKGTSIVIPLDAIHHDPKYYPDPERFDPERFNEEEKKKRHRYIYMPFGEGPRVCIGMRFGLMQGKMGLASLLHKYQFSVCNKTQIPLQMNVMAFGPTPVGGIWIQIKNR